MGHPISMTFNKDNTYNTVLGGCCTMGINFFLVWLFYIYVENTFNRNLDDYFTTTVLTEFDNQQIRFNES